MYYDHLSFHLLKKLKSIVRTLIFLSFYFYIFILVCFGLSMYSLGIKKNVFLSDATVFTFFFGCYVESDILI